MKMLIGTDLIGTSPYADAAGNSLGNVWEIIEEDSNPWFVYDTDYGSWEPQDLGDNNAN